MKSTTLALSLLLPVLGVSAGPVDGNLNAASLVNKPNDPLFMNTEIVGASHGASFSEEAHTNADGRMTRVDLKGCSANEHLSYISTLYRYKQTVYGKYGDAVQVHWVGSDHGTNNGTPMQLDLKEGEYIKQVDLTTWQAKTGMFHKSKRTRIGSIKLYSNKGKVVSCGASGPNDPKTSWHFDNYALHYFKGSAGDAIDALSATFIRADHF